MEPKEASMSKSNSVPSASPMIKSYSADNRNNFGVNTNFGVYSGGNSNENSNNPDLQMEEPTITELPNSVTQLISPITGATVFIVGTAHVSRLSVDEVKEVIRFVRPEDVFLELCRSRISILYTPDSPNDIQSSVTLFQALQSAKRDGIFSALLGYLYSGVKDKLNILPGAEFRVAFAEARKLGSCRVTLGDRPVGITLKRIWANLGIWEKLKLIYTLVKESRLDITEQDIENMKDTDIITSMLKELSKQFPNIARPLIYERDEYLCYTLRHCKGPKVVAVVGLGHVEGIKKCWESELDIKNLSSIPVQGFWTLKKIGLVSLSSFVVFCSFLFYFLIKSIP